MKNIPEWDPKPKPKDGEYRLIVHLLSSLKFRDVKCRNVANTLLISQILSNKYE